MPLSGGSMCRSHSAHHHRIGLTDLLNLEFLQKVITLILPPEKSCLGQDFFKIYSQGREAPNCFLRSPRLPHNFNLNELAKKFLCPILGRRRFTVTAAGGKKMKAKFLALILMMGLVFTTSGGSFSQNATPKKISFKILTINLLFSEIVDRTTRLTRIADYVKSTYGSSSTTPVDVLLLQEVVGGSLVGTNNSAQDLQTLLANRGLTYYLDYHLEESVLIPGVFTQGIAILSRYPRVASQFTVLANVEKVTFLGITVTLPRICLMNGITIPNYGQLISIIRIYVQNATPQDEPSKSTRCWVLSKAWSNHFRPATRSFSGVILTSISMM